MNTPSQQTGPSSTNSIPLHCRLGDCTIDLQGNRVWRDGEWVRLEPKAMGVLKALLAANGSVVSRASLLDQVWCGLAVTDAVLTVAVSALRRAFADKASSPKYIETVPRAGYRLIADARAVVHSEPSRRFLTGRVTAAALVVAACATSAFFLPNPFSVFANAESAAPTSVAVLPIKTFGATTQELRLASNLTSGTISRLAGESALRVIAHREIERVATIDRSLFEVGRRCAVDRLVDASLQEQTDGSLRLDVSLIDLARNRHVWTESFSSQPVGVDLMLDSMSVQLAKRLQDPKLFPASL